MFNIVAFFVTSFVVFAVVEDVVVPTTKAAVTYSKEVVLPAAKSAVVKVKGTVTSE